MPLSFEERQQLKLLVSKAKRARLHREPLLPSHQRQEISERRAMLRAGERLTEGLEPDGPKHFRCMICDQRSPWNGHLRFRHKEGCPNYQVPERRSNKEESSQAA